MKIGDYVVRKKYNKDIVFQIHAIKENLYYLKGVEYRLLADAFEEDLEVYSLHKQHLGGLSPLLEYFLE